VIASGPLLDHAQYHRSGRDHFVTSQGFVGGHPVSGKTVPVQCRSFRTLGLFHSYNLFVFSIPKLAASVVAPLPMHPENKSDSLKGWQQIKLF